MMKMEFEQVARDADDISDWFKSFNLRVHNSRIERYATLIHEIANKIESEDGLSSDSIEYVKALFEYGELSTVYQAFGKHPPDGLDTLLGKMVSGPFSYVDESEKSSQARNFGFEANLGSRLRLAGLPVSFNHTGDVYSDFAEYGLYFQCKRLSSMKQTKKRIAAACKQIRKDIDRHLGSRAYGFVGLDITKICDENQIPLIDDSIQAIEYRLRQSRHRFMSGFIETENISYGSNTIGILIRNSCICLIENEEVYMYIQGYTLAKNPRISNTQNKFSDSFYQKLQANIAQ